MFAFPTTARSDNMLENFDLHDQIAVKTKEIRDEVAGPDVAHPLGSLHNNNNARVTAAARAISRLRDEMLARSHTGDAPYAVVAAQRAAAEQVSFFFARDNMARFRRCDDVARWDLAASTAKRVSVSRGAGRAGCGRAGRRERHRGRRARGQRGALRARAGGGVARGGDVFVCCPPCVESVLEA